MSYRTDERDRLRWVEQRVKSLIAGWREEAAEFRGSDHTASRGAVFTAAASLDRCAQDADDILTASHAPGGPPVDHFAEITRHLTAIRDLLAAAQAADAAGKPVLQRINADIRDGLEVPTVPPGPPPEVLAKLAERGMREIPADMADFALRHGYGR